jgi:hypothetical protein
MTSINSQEGAKKIFSFVEVKMALQRLQIQD